MLVPNINISIRDQAGQEVVFFDYCTDVSIKKSWKTLTDTAKVTIPRKLKLQGKNLVEFIKPGYMVTLYMGYNGSSFQEFSGYVSRIELKVPAVIHLEDEMWKLKQNSVSLSYREVSLHQLVSAIAPGYNIKTVDAQLGAFRVSNMSAAKVLEEVKKHYGLHSWFVGKTLYCGLPYILRLGGEVKHGFETNIIESDKLEYKTKEEARVSVRAVSMFPDNSSIEVKVGDEGGEQHTLHYYKISKEELQKRASADLDKLKYNGYRGSFKTFGWPFCNPTDTTTLSSSFYPERNGTLFIDEVEVLYGLNGFKRVIGLGGAAT
jgi:hypothetical protein